MKVTAIRSDKVYNKILNADIDKKDDIYRYDLMNEFAHECNHNVRFQFIEWSNDITLEEMMINEGLAENFATWIYGEEIPEGLPFCAGYACGYYMIKYYLQKTGKSIIEATLMPYEEIKKELVEFWQC